jgi:hypothetical protein
MRIPNPSFFVFLFALMVAFGGSANVFYFRIVAKMRSAGYSPPFFTSVRSMLAVLKAYSQMAPDKGWPKWLVTSFWAAAIVAFLAAVALATQLK